MRRLGFKEQLTLDLLVLLVGVAVVTGKVVNLQFLKAVVAGGNIPNLLTSPINFGVSLFFGILIFYYFTSKRHLSPFEVGDQLIGPFVVGHFLYDLLPLISLNFKILLPIKTLLLPLNALLLVVVTYIVLSHKFFRGLRIFTALALFIVMSVSEDHSQLFSLTFWMLSLLLLLIGVSRRLQPKFMATSISLMSRIKDRLFKKKRQLEEEQLKLPQDDPFLMPHRADFNTDEDDIDEQAGHATIIAQSDFLDESEKRVKQAVTKVEKGTYGICDNCGQKINIERLEADPSATLCIECALRRDGRHAV